MWLLSWEEEETSAILAQVALAPLAKNCSSQELPTEIVVGKKSTEVCREPAVTENPPDPQLGKCCPQPPSSLDHGPWALCLPCTEARQMAISSARNALQAVSLVFPLISALSLFSPVHNTREEAAVCETGLVPSQTHFSYTIRAVKHVRQSSTHRFHRALVQLTQPKCASTRSAHIKQQMRTSDIIFIGFPPHSSILFVSL